MHASEIGEKVELSLEQPLWNRILERSPLLTYLGPGRYAEIRETRDLSVPTGLER